MTELPADQRLLLDEILAKLKQVPDQPGLIRFMSQVLRSLLRRQGDSEFLATIQDAYSAGIAGLDWDEQRALATEVIRVVIDKRPEIARAWQATQAAAAASSAPAAPAPVQAPLRRAADAAPPPPPPAAPPAPAGPAYEFAAIEQRLGEYVSDILLRRLELLRVKPAEPPSIAYCFTQPFFLFGPSLPAVLRDFLIGPLLQNCRANLEKRVYRGADAAALASDEAWKVFMAERRDTVWKVLLPRLSKLATAQKTGEAKLASAKLGISATQQYKVVEMPVTRPRMYSILGVEFALGAVTSTKRVRIKVPPAHELEPHEQEALDLIAMLRGRAAHAGIDLPAAVDFHFLRTLLEFNVRPFMAARDELMGLAGHVETNPTFLIERFKAVDETFNTILADILAMMLFTQHGDSRFGLAEFYSVCVGSARDHGAVGQNRPFVTTEIARRPRELAFQLREVLRRRLHIDVVLGAVEKLMECWRVLGRKRFGAELDAAQTVIGAFPMVFAGDSEEATFTNIAQMVQAAVELDGPEARAVLVKIAQTYDHIGRKATAIT